MIQSKKDNKAQESIQSSTSTAPVQDTKGESNKITINIHHKQKPSTQPFPFR